MGPGPLGSSAAHGNPPGTIRYNGRRDRDKDRIIGAAKPAKGTIKEAAGKALGDTKLAAERTSNEVEGKIENAIGMKDALKK